MMECVRLFWDILVCNVIEVWVLAKGIQNNTNSVSDKLYHPDSAGKR